MLFDVLLRLRLVRAGVYLLSEDGLSMPVTSVVIEVQDGVSEDILGRLALLSNVNVYGMKENQIVTVIEGESAVEVDDTVRTIQSLVGVVGVYPVYSGEYE